MIINAIKDGGKNLILIVTITKTVNRMQPLLACFYVIVSPKYVINPNNADVN